MNHEVIDPCRQVREVELAIFWNDEKKAFSVILGSFISLPRVFLTIS